MKNKIKISKPYIKKGDSEVFGKSVKLCANITMINPNTNKKETKECYFEFETEYSKFLCDERSDAFVTGLLTTAMENNMDIEFETPISEQLYYQLMTYYIPMVSKHNSNYPMHNIKLIGPYENKIIKNNNAVVTGCSGGVDSFYTILKLGKECEFDNYKLTHLIFNSCGTGDHVKERIISVYKDNLKYLKEIALDCDLKLISCFNNLYEFYKFPLRSFITFYSPIYGAAAYALQKLISVYYASSGDPITEFCLDLSKAHGYDSSTFDVFTLPCLNTENLKFYSAGMEYGRIEKEKYISKYKQAQKYLKVCNIDEFAEEKMKYPNCSKCPKCMRTMGQLYALNELDKFNKVFDTDSFFKNKNKHLGKMIALNKKAYVVEMEEVAKRNNIKIPLNAYLYAYLWYKPIKILRKTFKDSVFMRKVYYKFKIDYLLDGYRGANYEKYKDRL